MKVKALELIDKVYLNATSCRWKFSKINSDACARVEDSDFCKEFSESLKISSKDFVGELKKIMDDNEDMDEQAFTDYLDEVHLVLKRIMDRYSDKIEKGRLGCYFTQVRKQMEGFKEEFRNENNKFLDETLEDFADQVLHYQDEINKYNQKITTSYRICMHGSDIKTCLADYLKVCIFT